MKEYKLIQHIKENENGVPEVLSTYIEIIEGGEDLLTTAVNHPNLKKLLKENYNVIKIAKLSDYIGIKKEGRTKYCFIIKKLKYSIHISVPKEYELEKHLPINFKYPVEDKLFPYMDKWLLEHKEDIDIVMTTFCELFESFIKQG